MSTPTPPSSDTFPAVTEPILSKTIRSTLLLLLALLCCAYAWRPFIDDSDFWAHAAIGRWIVQHHQVPHSTLFLFTAHSDWVAHSWLSGVIFYELMRTFGEQNGPFAALTATCLLSAAAILWSGGYFDRRSQPNLLMGIVCVLAIGAASARFQARPELFTIVILIALLQVLWYFKLTYAGAESNDNIKRRIVVGIFIFAIIAVWTNLHGGVILGVCLVVFNLLGFALQRRKALIWRDMLFCSCLAGAGTLINPYGLHYYSIYNQVSSFTFHNIDEWKPFWIPPFFNPAYALQALLVCWAGFYGWYQTKQKDWGDLVILASSLIMFLGARRNIFIVCIVSLFLAWKSGAFSNQFGEPVWKIFPSGKSFLPNIQSKAPGFCAVLLAVAIVAGFTDAITDIGGFPLTAVSTVDLPAKQADYVLSLNPPVERVFNDYDTGAYLDWRFGGHPELYIDSLNAYPDSVFQSYLTLLSHDDNIDSDFQSMNVRCVFGRRLKPQEDLHPKLYTLLLNDPSWKFRYFDFEGPVWVKKEHS